MAHLPYYQWADLSRVPGSIAILVEWILDESRTDKECKEKNEEYRVREKKRLDVSSLWLFTPYLVLPLKNILISDKL